MSQIKFETEFRGKQVEVMSGWDHPLMYYHLTIFNTDPEAEEEILWSGLDHIGLCKNINIIKKTLISLGIDPPENFFEIINKCEGNIIYIWNCVEGKWDRTDVFG